MRVTIHQPEHLPWLGLLSKVAASHLWIVLDTVAFRKNYFQNRNRLLLAGAPTWLTVPVSARLGTPIRDVRVGADPQWQRRYTGRLQHALGHARGDPRLASLMAMVQQAVSQPKLSDLNMVATRWLLNQFQVHTRMVRASAFAVGGHKSELVRNLCLAVGADEYLAGPSSRDYLDLGDFARHGVKVIFFDYEHPTYEQGAPFVPYLSALDAWSRLAPEQLPALLTPFRLGIR